MHEQNTMAPGSRRGRIYDKDLPGVYRGKILPHGVIFQEQNGAKQTLVDLYMYDLLPVLYGVPVASAKINKTDGESCDPEPGDLVVVAFFGSLHDPIVIGFIPPANNDIQGNAAETPRRYWKRSGTWQKIGKDGTRTIHVAADDHLEVIGAGTVTIGGTLTINVTGNADITTPQATVHASEKIVLDTPLTECTGNLLVAGGIGCAGTYGDSGGKIQTPGDIESTSGDVKDQTRSMAADRQIYNGHDHNDPQGGLSSAPNQQE